jgi:hypothetical protein
VSQLLPAEGILGGGSIVTVVGSNFDESSDDVFCKFGDVATPASVVDSSSLTCVAPNNVAGPVFVQVTNHGGSNGSSSSSSSNYVHDGAQWTTDSVVYTYLRPLTVSSVSPRHAGVEGGTLLTVSGHDFPDVPSLCCVFDGSNIVSATFVDVDTLTCTTPAPPAPR